MECPNGCGDMEQLVSVSNELDENTGEMKMRLSKMVYERCHQCGHEETVDLEVFEEEFAIINPEGY